VRPLGFSEKWPKLQQGVFTTFRFKRRDKDWEVGEVVQVVYKPRQKGGGEKLGTAKIIDKGKRRVCPNMMGAPISNSIPIVSSQEAVEDGFLSRASMVLWISRHHKGRNYREPMNKLILQWEGTLIAVGKI
jgi:hypothetical protein